FRASATRSTQAKSREKQLDKIELVDKPDTEERTLEFHFPQAVRSGMEVATIKNLTHAYGDNVIFLDANLHITRGDRIAILGPNGSGKSTLLRILTGAEPALSGQAALGAHNVKMAYFEQNQAEALDLTKSVLDTIYDEVPEWKTDEVRGLLGRFLFSGDAVFKNVATLSGGEKARLALAKMLLGANNFLILDEPTNHLDIPAKETLEAALKKFDGTVVVVSHDRYFIQEVANKIVEIKDGQLVLYHGNYHYYLERKEKERLKEEEKRLAAEKAEKDAQKRAQRLAKEKGRKA
ncbi:MAG TPA: ATP-binding cassette domain-containing protein, partial [Candidatus Obscuribacter sp.]|nr:ATP-binding cassette domain-containing protein [Candidatus Obscuribacter sp.]